METLRLQNYRCFNDTGNIELKPIMYLLGANSAGKSSFLKMFPLLKQSLGVNLNGVFLWNDEDVDFKDFMNTVKSGENEMKVSFTLKDVPLLLRRTFRACKLSSVLIGMTITQDSQGIDFIKMLSISWGDGFQILVDSRNNGSLA